METGKVNNKPERKRLVKTISESFGLPSPSVLCAPEIFGWYHIGGERTAYLRHDPADGKGWSASSWDGDLAACNQWSAADMRELRDKMETLTYLRPPALPANVREHSAKPCFVHEGWLFCWLFTPVTGHWSLVPVAKL